MNGKRPIAAIAILYVLFALPETPAAFDLLGLAHVPWEPVILLLLPGVLPPRVWGWVKPVLVALLTVAVVVKVAVVAKVAKVAKVDVAVKAAKVDVAARVAKAVKVAKVDVAAAPHGSDRGM